MNNRWSRKQVALHWLSAAILVSLVAAGFVMTSLPPSSSLRLLLSRSHSVLGFTLMLVTAARLVVRWRGQNPAPLPLPPLHRRGIAVVHGLLYAAIFAMGASGVMTAVRSDWHEYIWGRLASAPPLAHLSSRAAHGTIIVVLLALVAVHVGGVVVEQMRRGGALRRMVPFVK